MNTENYIITFRDAATGSIITASRRTENAARKAIAELAADPAVEWVKGHCRKNGRKL